MPAHPAFPLVHRLRSSALTRIYVSIALALVALPWGVSPTAIALGILLLVWLPWAVHQRRWRGLRRKEFLYLTAAYAVWLAVTLVYTTDISRGIAELRKVLLLPAIAVVVASLPKVPLRLRQNWVHAYVAGLFLSFGIGVVVAIFRFSTGSTASVFFYHSFREGFSSVGTIFLSFYVGTGFLLVLYGWLQRRMLVQANLRRFLLPALVLLLMYMLLLASRMVIAATACAGVWLAFRHTEKPIQLVRITVGTLLLLLTIGLAVPQVRARVGSLFSAKLSEVARTDYAYEPGPYQNGLTLRLIFWRLSAESLEGHEWLGHGAGDYQAALNAEFKRVRLPTVYNDFGAHNQLIQDWLRGGVPLATLFVAVVVALFRVGLSEPLLQAFAMLFVLAALTDTYLSREFGITAFALFSSLLIWQAPYASLPTPRHPRQSQ